MISKEFSRGFLVLMACFAAPAFSQTREASSSGELLDRVAATVNEGVVLSSELDEQMLVITDRLRSQNQQLPPQSVLRQQVLTAWCCRSCRCSERTALASRCRTRR